MLKDIQKAISKAFNDLDVQLSTNNEAYEDRDTFAFILAADIFRELNTQQSEAKPKATRKKKEDEPKPEEVKPTDPQPQPPIASRPLAMAGSKNE